MSVSLQAGTGHIFTRAGFLASGKRRLRPTGPAAGLPAIDAGSTKVPTGSQKSPAVGAFYGKSLS
jgi:hypothetical protein